MLLCFFGHHRSASSWTNDILRMLCQHSGWRHVTVHNKEMFYNDLQHFIKQTKPNLLTFSNAKLTYLNELPEFFGFHVIRDPRDIIVSSYFSHRNSHPSDQWPELIAHRSELRNMSQEEGLIHEMECRREQLEDMRAWNYNRSNIYEIKMETLTENPEKYVFQLFKFWNKIEDHPTSLTFLACLFNGYVHKIFSSKRLSRFLSVPLQGISPALIKQVVSRNTFRKKSGGRPQGTVDTESHYRCGTRNQWRTYFNEGHIIYFKKNYADLLIKLGYEKDNNW